MKKNPKTSKNFPDAFYRVSVREIVRDGNNGAWETFGGGLDFGENLHKALKREILKKTGCEVYFRRNTKAKHF